MATTNIFAIYPEETTINDCINSTKELVNSIGLTIEPWPNIDIPGRFIVDGVLDNINSSDYILADITKLNFNVIFEIGYAIAKQKRVVAILNESFSPQIKEINSLGILDTLGYKKYQNSYDLKRILSQINDYKPLHFPPIEINQRSPVYVLDTLYKTDASIRILSRLKKLRTFFRSYDPQEQFRISTIEAYKNVSQSVAIIIQLLASTKNDYLFNNLRGAFIAGISFGLEKEIVILQEGDEPVPIDYRDFVNVYKHPEDVDKYINPLGPKVVESLQLATGSQKILQEGFLEKLDLGSPAAENEIQTLQHYFMKTDEYNKILRTGARLAVGRKGSGKTALFFQVRDKLRQNKKVFVLDLKPQGHQLKRFKHLVLSLLNEATREHTATAFWEYVIFLEICYKILDKDKQLHMHDHELFKPYQALAELYASDIFIEEADFSERMLKLINRISEIFQEKFGNTTIQYLTAGDVTSFLYQHDLHEMRNQLIKYLLLKESVVILFDNIDKGWPTKGIKPDDIILVRGLLDATRKIEREFQKNRILIHTTVFLRSDVYEILVEETPDRGKESKVSLDWTDPDMLKEFLRRRIVYNDLGDDLGFDDSWKHICISHISGEDSAEYLIERSLMRPRNFLNLVNHCKSSAVNLKHSKITEEDIIKALGIYSKDISNDIGLEIRDVYPEAEDILYYFIEKKSRFSIVEIKGYLEELKISNDKLEKLLEILLWFGFLGIVSQVDGKECYIYNVHYDIKKLKRLAYDFKNDSVCLCIHKAFWPFLEINE